MEVSVEIPFRAPTERYSLRASRWYNDGTGDAPAS